MMFEIVRQTLRAEAYALPQDQRNTRKDREKGSQDEGRAWFGCLKNNESLTIREVNVEKEIKSSRKIFLCLLCLFWVCNFARLGFGQEKDKPPQETNTARHYIILLDATGSFTRNIGTKEYFSFAREMITNNSITQKG
ncbi:MAG: hypothetical protein JSV88_14785, partial [Candidatus Aminicenantes bacterium]